MPWVLSYFYHRQVPPASIQLLPPLLALPLYLNLKCYTDGGKGGATQLLLPLVGSLAVYLLCRTVSTAAWYLLVALPPGRCGEHPGDLARGEEAAWVASPEYFHPGTLRSLFHFAKVETKGREAPAERREVSGSELRWEHSTLLMNEAFFAMHRFCVRCLSRSREWRGWSQLLRRSSRAEARHTDRHREEADRRNPSSSPVSGGQAGSKPCDFKTCFILGSEVRGPNWISASTAACVTAGARACLPTALWRRVPVYTDTLFVSIGACLAGGPTHPECCFGMKLGMEPDATENLGKGSLPSEAGRAECSYPQGFKRQSQVDIIKKKSWKMPRISVGEDDALTVSVSGTFVLGRYQVTCPWELPRIGQNKDDIS